MIKLPDVTIIVPTYLQESTLEPCIKSILNQTYSGDISLIVVDNSELFGLNALKEKYPNVTFLWEKAPGSYNARNAALAITHSEIIAFTDSDCLVDTLWLSNAVTYLDMYPDIGFIGGKISVFPKSTINLTIPDVYEQILAFPQRTFVEEGGYAATANMVTKSSTLKSVGTFNGNLKSRGDMEWGQRATNSGCLGAYVDNAVVYHPARDHDEIISKLRRVVAGARDKEPGWINCFKHAFRSFLPRRNKILKIIEFKKTNKSISVMIILQVILYSQFLSWYEGYLRLKFELTKEKSPR